MKCSAQAGKDKVGKGLSLMGLDPKRPKPLRLCNTLNLYEQDGLSDPMQPHHNRIRGGLSGSDATQRYIEVVEEVGPARKFRRRGGGAGSKGIDYDIHRLFY